MKNSVALFIESRFTSPHFEETGPPLQTLLTVRSPLLFSPAALIICVGNVTRGRGGRRQQRRGLQRLLPRRRLLPLLLRFGLGSLCCSNSPMNFLVQSLPGDMTLDSA